MKKTKNYFENISSQMWIIIFCILTILVIKTGIESLDQTLKIEYGPYVCGNNTLVIDVDEHKNHVEGVAWNSIHFVWNKKEIKTIENYNFEGVQNFIQLPWKTKCSPVIVDNFSVIGDLTSCIGQKMLDGSLEQDRVKKNGAPFEICGVGYYDSSRKYE